MIIDVEFYTVPGSTNIEELIKIEKDAGIDKVVLMPDPRLRPDNAGMRAEAGNNDMFLLCASVNPKLGQESLDEFETAVTQWGFRGLKLMPPKHGYRVVDEIVYPFLEKAIELNVPVSIHSSQEQCHPADIGFMALEFPKARIIMDHMGYRYFVRQALLAAKHAPNLYLATTAVPEPGFIKSAVEKLGPERVVFGSNGPLMPPDLQIEVIRRAGLNSEDEALVLGGNAARLYGLDA